MPGILSETSKLEKKDTQMNRSVCKLQTASLNVKEPIDSKTTNQPFDLKQSKSPASLLNNKLTHQ